jgi:hypothetical protein
MKRKLYTSYIFLFALIAVFIFSSASYAAHPLITDDTGTQGKGKFQIEVNGQYDYDKETEEGVTTKSTGSEVASILSYGMTDNIDIVLGLAYQWRKEKEDNETTSDENGISDMSLEMKWRYYEKDGFSLALKPGVTFPTGDDKKGLGAGRAAYYLFLISTKEIQQWAFHLNLGYKRNENNADERKDIWHASATSEVEVIKNLKIVGDIGIEENPDKASKTDPAFIIGGVIYSITDDFDIDLGLKAGLNKPETDYTILAGTTFRF